PSPVASVAPAEGPDPFSDPAPEDAPPPPPPPAPARPVALDLALGVQLTHRALRWNDDLFGELRPYTLALGPWITLDARWFPAAHFTSGWPAQLGVYVGAGFAVGLSSSDSRGRSYDTSALDLRGGVRARVPLGPHALTFGAGVELRRFTLSPPDDPNDPGVPGVSYLSATLDADARVRLSDRVALLAGATAALPFALGDLADRLFPGATGAAVELRGGAAWAFLPGFELRAIASYRRYFLSMNPSPGDRWVAGGLVDEFASLGLSAAWRR
ncbi:MAG: hypothetical protein Q8S73_40685, partial [Deltaproteobacteria bacterium]|nr:hypothetical protein [Deltaproteobacteria bacterium]